jgi:hypothetical protein
LSKYKVICTRAHICDVADGCDHSYPHEVEIFESHYKGNPTKCTEWDECEEHRVRCVTYAIDFGIEEMFEL